MPEEKRLTLSAPPLVTEAVWDTVQALLQRKNGEGGGSPRQVRMLSGQTFCPHYGGKTGFKLQQANGKRYHYLICNAHKNARYQFGGSTCRGGLYSMATVEQAALQAVRDVWQKPSVLLECVFQIASVESGLSSKTRRLDKPRSNFETSEQSPKAAAPGCAALRSPFWQESILIKMSFQRIIPRLLSHLENTPEVKAILTALEELKKEELATGQAQVAGLLAGASPEIYAAMFADIRARRQALNVRRAELQEPAPSAPFGHQKLARKQDSRIKTVNMEDALRMFEQAWRVLTSPDIEGHVKRDLLLTVVDRVICQKYGAEVVFRPGIFGENTEAKTDNEGSVPTLHTTCMGMRTQR